MLEIGLAFEERAAATIKPVAEAPRIGSGRSSGRIVVSIGSQRSQFCVWLSDCQMYKQILPVLMRVSGSLDDLFSRVARSQ